MNAIKPINQFNSNLYNANNNFNPSDSNSNNSNLDFSQNLKDQEKDEYTKTPTSKISAKELYNLFRTKTPIVDITDYNPNDISLGITFADKNSKTIPTLDNVNSKNEALITTDTSTSLHTTVNGTRFLVVQMTVGEQTFEKSIKLNVTF